VERNTTTKNFIIGSRNLAFLTISKLFFVYCDHSSPLFHRLLVQISFEKWHYVLTQTHTHTLSLCVYVCSVVLLLCVFSYKLLRTCLHGIPVIQIMWLLFTVWPDVVEQEQSLHVIFFIQASVKLLLKPFSFSIVYGVTLSLSTHFTLLH
jgi:hypothetical protein